MATFINIADLPSDVEGKSWRQKNSETSHNIPIGSLVELPSGVRLFVVHHGRDCDMTPLYYLCSDKDDTVQERENFMNRAWDGGYGEDYLKVIKQEDEIIGRD